MDASARDFLGRLLAAVGPAGYEGPAASVWRAEATRLGLAVSHDLNGNSLARLAGAGPRVAIVGHIDELGLQVTYIDDSGYLWFTTIGGWDEQVLVGQRVRIVTRDGSVPGLIGRKPIHLMRGDEGSGGAKAKDLWIDIGAKDGAEARGRVRIGDAAVLEVAPVELPHNRLAARAIDNRVGAYVALETLRQLQRTPPLVDCYGVANVQEEITFKGAYTSAFQVMPTVAIIVDVTFATDDPSANKHSEGERALGSGPAIARGSVIHPLVVDRLIATAEREAIPYTLEALSRRTGTDADAIALTGAGIACGVVSIPSRYMHTPNETICLDDLDNVVRLLAAFIRSLTADDDWRI